MFWNYLKVAARNLLKHKVFSFINIFGLAIAMSVCLLIILMLADQNQYDQFHSKKDRIYRIVSHQEKSGPPTATTAIPLAQALKTDYPIIERTTHLIGGVGGDATYDQNTITVRGFFADSSFLQIFDFELERGNKKTALLAANSMVITSDYALRLFGEDNPMGKVLEFDDRGLLHLDIGGIDKPPTPWGKFVITGVIADKTYKSHLQFNALVSEASMYELYQKEKLQDESKNWAHYWKTYTYVLLEPGKTVNDLELSLTDLVERKYADLEYPKDYELIAQSMGDITPGKFMSNMSSFRMPIEAYYLLSFLALMIMLSACLNYTNLSIARALTRAKEIGVRKVTGALQKDLILQFLSESIITALLALILAALLLVVVKPAFMGLWINKFLNFDLDENIGVYLLFSVFALIIGILAGVFPALHLSKFKPVKVLGRMDSERRGKLGFKKFLAITQFVVSLFFIVTSILIYRQFKHFLEFDYGFTTENIINIELQSNDPKLISSELASVPGVTAISACEYIPATGITNSISLKKQGAEDDFKSLVHIAIDENFVSIFGLNLIAGRNVPSVGESTDRFILVNEQTADHFGFELPAEIVGQVFELNYGEGQVEVIGVVEDYQYHLPSIEDEIGPLVMRNLPEKFSYLNLKVASNDLMGTVSKLEKKWKAHDPVHPFEYSFLDEQLAGTHQMFVDLVSIIGSIAFIALTIACLGLLGMATYTAERRMKEVCIRKVFGAKEHTIALMLSKGFLIMLGISVIISAPMTYFLNNLWLQNFPNRVSFGLGTVLLGTLILLVLGLITIGSQTLRVSKGNPADMLRME